MIRPRNLRQRQFDSDAPISFDRTVRCEQRAGAHHRLEMSAHRSRPATTIHERGNRSEADPPQGSATGEATHVSRDAAEPTSHLRIG